MIGATDAVGLRAAEDKAHVHDIHATILHLLGFDHKRLTFRHNGRNERLTDNGGEVIEACWPDAVFLLRICLRATRADDAGRDANDSRVRRHVGHDDRVGADARSGADRHRSNHLCAGADEYVVTHDGAFAALSADRDLVFELHICAAADGAIDHHASRMDQDEPGPELRPAADDAIAKPRIDATEEHFERDETPSSGPLHESVPHHRRGAVREYCFHDRPGRYAAVVPLRLGAQVGRDELEQPQPTQCATALAVGSESTSVGLSSTIMRGPPAPAAGRSGRGPRRAAPTIPPSASIHSGLGPVPAASVPPRAAE